MTYAQTTSTVTPEQARAKRQAAIGRAMHKAREQAQAGNIPVLVRDFTSPDGLEQRQYWTVGSRTTGGVVYNVDLCASADGLTTLCHCDGANAGRLCWHRASVRLAALGELEHHTSRRATVATADPWTVDDVEAFAAAV